MNLKMQLLHKIGFMLILQLFAACDTSQPTPTPTLPALTSTPAPMPTAEAVPVVITDRFGVPMILVPAGSFQMGGDAGNYDEKPVHTITLDDFYIDQYEVTNARYAECVEAGACSPPSKTNSFTRSSYYDNGEYADYPVIYVAWDDTQTFCQWREARLPTEAEWEKAARGGLEGASYLWHDVPACDEDGPAQGGDSEWRGFGGVLC